MKKIISVLLAVIMVTAAFSLFSFTGAKAARGDVNGDGSVNNKDVAALFRFVSGSAGTAIEENCDVNGDGTVNNKDVAFLFRGLNNGTLTEEPEVLSDIYFDKELDRGIDAYFTRASYSASEKAEDGDAGKVLRLKTKNIKITTARPYIYFKYAEFCGSVGAKAATLAERPFVVLKIKAEKVHDNMFSALAAAKITETESTRTELSVRTARNGDWQYVCFDFSGVSSPEDLTVLRFRFEELAGEDGESILISEIHFYTEEEAAGYSENTPDLYPVKEQTADNYELRLLQFNVQTENGNPIPFILRSDMYRRLVDELMPDVVGMQEVTVTWRSWLDRYVFNDSYAGVGEMRSAGGEANPIYYRKDKFDLVESGTFWLSDTPDVPGSQIAEANYPRICTWVVLRDKATGTEFAHMNTHLDHNGNNNSTVGASVRNAQTKTIVKFAQKFGDMPLFLSGDLNTKRTKTNGETYAVIKYIEGTSKVKDEEGNTYTLKLSDARLTADKTVDENHTATMTKYYDETSSSYEPAREPIDYVFYNQANTKALSYETFLISENGNWISDHLPVFTTFRIDPLQD